MGEGKLKINSFTRGQFKNFRLTINGMSIDIEYIYVNIYTKIYIRIP
jgi:hypothetical protein